MTAQGVAVDHDQADPEPTCWCCGRHYPEDSLVRLGSHPEAGVCFQCAKFLHRRAREQAGQAARLEDGYPEWAPSGLPVSVMAEVDT